MALGAALAVRAVSGLAARCARSETCTQATRGGCRLVAVHGDAGSRSRSLLIRRPDLHVDALLHELGGDLDHAVVLAGQERMP